MSNESPDIMRNTSTAMAANGLFPPGRPSRPISAGARGPIRGGLGKKQAVGILIAAALASFILVNVSLTLFLAVIGLIIILIFSILNLRAALLFTLAVKPFMDLAWNANLFSLGSKSINVLHIIGIYIFIIAAYMYIFQSRRRGLFNEKLIWAFLVLHVLSALTAIIFYKIKPILCIDSLLRLFDAYLIYFIIVNYQNDEREKLQLINIFWKSTLLVTILSIFVYLSGRYNVDVSQDVERYAGLYNDPGTPAYIAIISLVFATVYMEKRKKADRPGRGLFNLLAFLFTAGCVVLILAITVTKSAMVMLIVFMMMWLGIYKKRALVVVPGILLGSIFFYQSSQQLQLRLADEMEFFQEGEFTIEAARPMGEGRVAYWERTIRYYRNRFSLFQKAFGEYRTHGAHNQYIAYLMQIGLVGLLMFLAIIFRFYGRLIRQFREARSPEIFMAAVVLSMFMVYGMTGHPFEYTTLLWYLMIFLSYINANNRRSA